MSDSCVCDLNDCECEKVCNNSNSSTSLTLQIVLPTVLGIIFVIASRYIFNYLKKAINLKYDKGIRLIV